MYGWVTQLSKALAGLARHPKTREQALSYAMDLSKKTARLRIQPAWQERAQRRIAEELARQTKGAQLSYRTVLNRRPHTVVWVDGAPYEAFPEFEGDLGAALSRFDTALLKDPPTNRPHVWSRDRWRRGSNGDGDEATT